MSRTIYLPTNSSRSGIDITWTKTSQRIDIGGWYDTIVGIESSSFTLHEFLDALGITEQDCKKAWKK